MSEFPDEITNEDVWRLKLRLHALVWFRVAAAVFVVSLPALAAQLDGPLHNSPVNLAAGLALLVFGGVQMLLLAAIGKERVSRNLKPLKAAVYGSMAIAASPVFMPVILSPPEVFSWITIVLVAVAFTELLMAGFIPHLSRRLGRPRSPWGWVPGKGGVARLLWTLGLLAVIMALVLLLELPRLGSQGAAMAAWLMLGLLLLVAAQGLYIANTLFLARLVKHMDDTTAEDLTGRRRDREPDER